VPGLEDIRLHLGDEVLSLWRAVQVETGDPDAALPYWAFAWTGGLALARHLRAQPELVRGRRIFDIASGSGLCAIAAMRAGALSATAADVDAMAAAAIALNARANGTRVAVVQRDILGAPPPDDIDLILAGDCFYEASLGARVRAWLMAAQARGIDVLIGDPVRQYLPLGDLRELASYEVRTTTELEDIAHKIGRVYALRVAGAVPAR
jgi:predicted nicotinamide N-methyase